MKRVLDDDLAYEILSVVEEVPEGKVATYGQIARLIGRHQNSRLIGLVLRRAQYYGDYPCHRYQQPCREEVEKQTERCAACCPSHQKRSLLYPKFAHSGRRCRARKTKACVNVQRLLRARL